MAYTSDFRRLLTVAAALTLSAVMIGCNHTPTGLTETNQYRVQGVLVQEMNIDYAFATARFWRNDTTLTNASIRLAGVPMAFFAAYQNVDSAYQALISPAASHAGTVAYLRVADASRFADSVLLNIVDTFSITDNFQPPNHQVQGTNNYVTMEWTAADSMDGYIVAAVKASRAYTGVGYSAAVTAAGVAGTIPPEAFMDTVANLPDTGLYNVYVYAYSGAPDVNLANAFLPVPLPAQVADNIERTSLTGRFGAITVSLKDTVRVLAQ